MGRVARWVGVAALVCTLVGCRVQGRVDIDVARNGSGTVSVAVGLDDDAAGRVGNLATAVKTTDLTAAGWTVAKPQKQGTITWLRATKPFRSPGDLHTVLGEIGLLPGWHLRVTNGFGSTSWKLRGRIVSTGSIDQFSDSALETALDGLPLGLTPAQEAADLKASGPIPLTVHLHLPARVTGATSYTLDVVGGPATSRTVTASATDSDHAVIRWFILAGLLVALGLVLALLGRLRAGRRASRPGLRARRRAG